MPRPARLHRHRPHRDGASSRLRRGGRRTYGWNQGLNRGARADTIDRLTKRLAAIAPDGAPVLVVGWSLGGVFARELARTLPGRVAAVVTLGSPFSGDPRWNNVWRLYERVAGHPVDRPPLPRNPAKPPVPTLALWSRRDGVIAPRSAYGLDEERDSAVELSCTHMGFAVSRTGTRAVTAATRAFLVERGLPVP